MSSAYVNELMTKVKDRVEDVMQELVEDVDSQLRKNMSIPVVRSGGVTIRSKPGEYPRKDKGLLVASTQHTVYHTEDVVHGVVATNTAYDQFLIRLRRDFQAYTESEWVNKVEQRFNIAMRV
jgi:hypothetical protein